MGPRWIPLSPSPATGRRNRDRKRRGQRVSRVNAITPLYAHSNSQQYFARVVRGPRKKTSCSPLPSAVHLEWPQTCMSVLYIAREQATYVYNESSTQGSKYPAPLPDNLFYLEKYTQRFLHLRNFIKAFLIRLFFLFVSRLGTFRLFIFFSCTFFLTETLSILV